MMINKLTFHLILLLLIPLSIACSNSTNESSEELDMSKEYYAFIELEDQNGETMGKVKIELYVSLFQLNKKYYTIWLIHNNLK